MTFNNEIYIQREISKRTRLLLVSNRIRRNIESHDKKENEKRNIETRRDKISNKKRYTRKSYIKIPKETINISRR